LLDEVGRGTSTADGLAIAQATTEFIHDELDALTLFATHYHGLTDLADERAGVHNLHFAATREGDDVTFLHRVAPGASSASYGIEVARMAGVPTPVVARAREVVETTTGDSGDSDAAADTADDAAGQPASDNDTTTDPTASAAAADDALADALADQTLDAETVAAVAAELQELDIATMTPLEALNTLDELRTTLER
jgi:DNA mismatch repair protein MutS